MIRQCIPIPQKIYSMVKRLQTLEEVKHYFPGFSAFIDSTEQQIPRPVDNRRRKMYYSGKKKRHTTVKTQLIVNNQGIIIHKTDHKKRKKKWLYIHIYKRNHPVTPKEVVYVFDFGYLGVEKDFPEQQYHPYRIKRKEIWTYHKKKNSITKVILERE